MTTATQKIPRTIKARMHPDTLSRISRMFNASTEDVFRKPANQAQRGTFWFRLVQKSR